jgi:predicted DNA-binding protein
MKQEIKQLENQINELSVLKASTINGMPKGNGTSSPVERFYERVEKLEEKLQAKREQYIIETERIEDYIENIEDAQVRVIARMRFIEHKKYHVIGAEVFTDGSTARKKLKRYLEGNEENG